MEVTPEEAEKVALATTEGRLQLSLRNFGDTESVVTHGATVSTLVGSQSPNPPREMRPPARREVEVQKPVSQVTQVPPPPVENKVENPRVSTHTVELIKGSKVSEVKFEGSE